MAAAPGPRARGAEDKREAGDDRIEDMLDEHGPGEAAVALFLNDDVYLRSYNHARSKLGIPLPPPDW